MSRVPSFKFRLYIAGDTENSAQALSNLTALCGKHLENRHEIEIVDIFREPGRALQDRIFMTPTLVKLAPGHVQRIIGTLGRSLPVMQTLGLGALAI
jgi:circadian clock protein KaiB